MAKWVRWSGIAGVALAIATPSHAQLTACALPKQLPRLRASAPVPMEQRRVVPIGSYTLALSWSPQYCAGRGGRDAFQCGGRDNRFGFILHGLWPNGVGAQYPQYCRAAQPVTASVLRENLCATPSADLIQHEWAKHGTCMSGSADAYFDRARGLYAKLRFPDMRRLAQDGKLTRSGFMRAFLAANQRTAPALKADAVRVRLTSNGWLEEVRICLDKAFRYTSCQRNAGSAGAPGQRMKIRPSA